MTNSTIPGVIREESVPRDDRLRLPTGVCGFIGATVAGPVDPATGAQRVYEPVALRRADEFRAIFGTMGALAAAIDGFFACGGSLCYVVRTDRDAPLQEQLEAGLAALAAIDAVDLLYAPDIVASPPTDPLLLPAYHDHVARLQRLVLEHCARAGDRFAILDAPAGSDLAQLEAHSAQLASRWGALYYPWLVTASGGVVPPGGHIAGVYARTDAETGVFRAPANRELVGVLDLAPAADAAMQAALQAANINVIRALPGRGIRVMGARTLAGRHQPEWQAVNVARVFVTVGRWVERALRGLTFEPNDLRLWARTRREITGYLLDLWRAGGLQGERAEDAFRIRCDATTNPPATRDAGLLIAEIGLAPVVPAEFVVVKIVQRNGATTLE